MPCPLVGQCTLPAALKSHVALLLWRRKSCEEGSAFSACERFKLAQGGRPIPAGMLPNGYRLALTEP